MDVQPHSLFALPSPGAALLTTPRTLEVGPYHGWGGAGEQPFVVELDALPLRVLLEEAALGSRIYETLTISRPGDILNYLRVRLVEVAPQLSKRFAERDPLFEPPHECGDGYLPFVTFDGAFYWAGDDTEPDAACWRGYRESPLWRELAEALLLDVRAVQRVIRDSDDFLTRREVARIDSGEHPRAMLAQVSRACRSERRTPDHSALPIAFLRLIDDLVTRDTVASVSCPLPDYWLWRRLVEEQIRRSDKAGCALQTAFSLSGPDGGLRVPFEDWGADVHIPYEGACGADLFIKPYWRRTNLKADARGGSLSDVVFAEHFPPAGYVCHYLLTQEDMGILHCATRTDVGDGWVLYESNRPYEPNPLFKAAPVDQG